VAFRALVHHQGEDGTGPDERTVEERQRGQSQEAPEPGNDQGQELERQGTADGKREVGIRRQGGPMKEAMRVRATTECVQQLSNRQTSVASIFS
jgi:hypothetical protein